jgi:hypothetical protein
MEFKMMTKLTAALGAVSLTLSMAIAAPAFAMDNNPMGTVTQDTLKADGYTCEYVATNFWECTKPGGTTYWCDASSCQPKPARTGGIKGLKLNGLKLNNLGLMTTK